MQRREFITLLGGAAAAWPMLWPRVVRAQPPDQVRHVGVLLTAVSGDPEWQLRIKAFVQELQTLGWMVGRNLQIDYRKGALNPTLTRAAAAELVGLAPSVIVALASANSVALRDATHTIPIVFVSVSDPLSSGLVDSMARPGGNLTGFVNFEFPIGGKWLETLKEVAPGIKRVLVFHTPNNIGNQGLLKVVIAAGATLGVTVVPAPAVDAAAMGRSIDTFAQEPNGGLLALPGSRVIADRQLIVALAAQRRLPAIYSYREFAVNGGLMSYDTDIVDLMRRTAGYVDRILRGEKPADLPVQAPTKFELTINLKTAKALGLTIPVALLARADRVIE